jgi:hypothetical protein
MTENTHDEFDEWTTESDAEMLMRSDYMYAEAGIAPREDYEPADDDNYSKYASYWIRNYDRWFGEWVYLEEAVDRWWDAPAAAEQLMLEHEDVMSPSERRSEEQARWIAEQVAQRGNLDGNTLLTSHYVTRVADRESEIREQRRAALDSIRDSAARSITADPWSEAVPPIVDQPWSTDHVADQHLSCDAVRYDPAMPVPSFGAAVAARTSALANYRSGNTLTASDREHDGMEQ